MAQKPQDSSKSADNNPEKERALSAALAQIERQFGKGSMMRLGDQEQLAIPSVSTGSLGLDVALGIGGLPRGRVVEIYGPESSGKTTLTLQVIAEAQKVGGTCAFIDAEHALDPQYAQALGVDTDNLLVSQPDTGEQALEICDMLVPLCGCGCGGGGLGSRTHAEGRNRRGDGRHPRRFASTIDEPGITQNDR